MAPEIRAGIVTVSDRGARGEREDASGPILRDLLKQMGAQVTAQHIVPDEKDKIAVLLQRLCEESLGSRDDDGRDGSRSTRCNARGNA